MAIFHPVVDNAAVTRKKIEIQRRDDRLHVQIPQTNGNLDRDVTGPIVDARRKCIDYLESKKAAIRSWGVGQDQPRTDGTWDDIRRRSSKKSRSSLTVEVDLPGEWTEAELGREFGIVPATEPLEPEAGAEALSAQVDPKSISSTLRAYRNVIIEGVAGTGKSHLIQWLKKEFGGDRVRVVVFHPATSYEDFVEGLRPQGNDFVPRDGVFLELCRRAAQSPDIWVLVIDEINRANTAKVLGDLLYAIEPSKRVARDNAAAILSAKEDDPRHVSVTPWTVLQLERPAEESGTARQPVKDVSAQANLQLEQPGKESGKTFRQRLVVPDNLLILGTMNTTDRSVGTLDLALRRRFVVVRMQPMSPASLKNELRSQQEGGGPVSELDKDIDQWLQLNQKLGTSIGPDALLGHSYFFDFVAASTRDGAGKELNIWRDLLLPQLGEILVAFNAIDRIGELLAGLDTGGWTLKQIGSKVDGYPIVVERRK